MSSCTRQARELGLDPSRTLAELAAGDLVHVADGVVSIAHPFSGTPTPHSAEAACGTTRLFAGPSTPRPACATDHPDLAGRVFDLAAAEQGGGCSSVACWGTATGA